MFVIVYQINGTVFYQEKSTYVECLEERNIYQGMVDFFEIYNWFEDANMRWDLTECERIPYSAPAQYGL